MICAVEGCSSYSEIPNDEVSFFRIPSAFKLTGDGGSLCPLRLFRREQWLKAINNLSIDDSARVCARHFIYGKPASLSERDHPDWIPTLYLKDDASRPALDEYMSQTNISGVKRLTEKITDDGKEEDSEEEPASIVQVPKNQKAKPTVVAQKNNGKEVDKSSLSTQIKIKNENPSNETAKDTDLPANMVRDGLDKIWLTNKDGKVEKVRDGVVLVVDPKAMTVTAKIIPKF